MIARVALLVAVLAPCLGGATTKTTPAGSAAIVELRDHARLAAVVAQARTALPLDWIVHVFHGPRNGDVVASHGPLRAALRAGTVVQHKLAKASRDGGASKDHYGYSNAKDYAARTGWYNRLLGSPSFWRRFASEYVLIFELDAAFCDRPSAPLAAFLGYAYVGAPWKDCDAKARPSAKCVGNSGLSLWRAAPAVELAARAPPQGREHVDRWASRGFRRRNASAVAPEVLAAKFSVETTYAGGYTPFGVHAADRFLSGSNRDELLTRCPAACDLFAFRGAPAPKACARRRASTDFFLLHPMKCGGSALCAAACAARDEPYDRRRNCRPDGEAAPACGVAALEVFDAKGRFPAAGLLAAALGGAKTTVLLARDPVVRFLSHARMAWFSKLDVKQKGWLDKLLDAPGDTLATMHLRNFQTRHLVGGFGMPVPPLACDAAAMDRATRVVDRFDVVLNPADRPEASAAVARDRLGVSLDVSEDARRGGARKARTTAEAYAKDHGIILSTGALARLREANLCDVAVVDRVNARLDGRRRLLKKAKTRIPPVGVHRGPYKKPPKDPAVVQALAARTTMTSDAPKSHVPMHRAHAAESAAAKASPAATSNASNATLPTYAPSPAAATYAPTASTFSDACGAVEAAGGVEVCSRPDWAARVPDPAVFARGSPSGPVYLFVISDGSSASTPVLMLLAQSIRVRTLCVLGVWACEGEKALVREGIMTMAQRDALHGGNYSAFAPGDVDWPAAFAEFDKGWAAAREAQLKSILDVPEDERPKLPSSKDSVFVDKSPAFAGCAANIADEAARRNRRVAFLFLTRFVCDAGPPKADGRGGALWARELQRLANDRRAVEARGHPTLAVRYEDLARRPRDVADRLRAWLPSLGAINPAKMANRQFVFGQGKARSHARGKQWLERLNAIETHFGERPPTTREVCTRVSAAVARDAAVFGYTKKGAPTPTPAPMPAPSRPAAAPPTPNAAGVSFGAIYGACGAVFVAWIASRVRQAELT